MLLLPYIILCLVAWWVKTKTTMLCSADCGMPKLSNNTYLIRRLIQVFVYPVGGCFLPKKTLLSMHLGLGCVMHTLLELASGSCKLWHGVSGEALVFCVMCCGLLFRFSRGYHKCSCPVSLKKNSKNLWSWSLRMAFHCILFLVEVLPDMLVRI